MEPVVQVLPEGVGGAGHRRGDGVRRGSQGQAEELEACQGRLPEKGTTEQRPGKPQSGESGEHGLGRATARQRPGGQSLLGC